MANPEKIDYEESVLAASTVAQSVGLSPNRTYSLMHRKLNEAGTVDEQPIFAIIGVSDAAVDHTTGLNKFKIMPNIVKIIGPGHRRISFIVASGAPCFDISPSAKMDF